MAYVFDGLAKTITLTAGTTAFGSQDLYSRWKDWVLEGNASFSNAFEAFGGNELGGSLLAGDYYFLQEGWTIIPQDADHVLQVAGNLYPSVAGVNMFGSRPGRSIQVQLSRSNLTQTVAVGSGVTPSDVSSIATASRNAILSDSTPFAGGNIDAAISSLVGQGLTTEQSNIITQLQTLVSEMHRITGLDSGAPLNVSQTERSAGDITINLSEDNGTVTAERAL
jgi:hypothetical protein